MHNQMSACQITLFLISVIYTISPSKYCKAALTQFALLKAQIIVTQTQTLKMMLILIKVDPEEHTIRSIGVILDYFIF